MKTRTAVPIGVGLALVLAGGEFVQTRHKLVTEHEVIGTEWSEVDSSLRRRSELLPGLVAIVRSSIREATTVYQELDAARGVLAGARTRQEKMDGNNQINAALGRMFLIIENYPNLKASDSFRDELRTLEGAENRILQARRRYNEAVRRYNTDIQVTPGNIVASVFGFQREDVYFKTEPDARITQKVQF